MVLTRAAGRLAPAVVVPDEQTWTVLGRDPAALGFEPAYDLAATRRVLLADRVAPQLGEALAALLGDMERPMLERRDLPLSAGTAVGELLGAAEEPEDHGDMGGMDHGDMGGMDHGDMGGMDHGDMMAITGDPSADGLVMEPIELMLGPLASPLPGGLTLSVTLDGDVVSHASFGDPLAVATVASGMPHVPDPLAPVAWSTAMMLAAGVESPEGRWPAIAAVELERALSHLAWLRAFARLLGWRPAVRRAGAAIALVIRARAGTAPGDGAAAGAALAAARSAAAKLAARLEAASGLRGRTAGRGVVSADQARRRGLAGPVARACGLAQDSRADDPAYAELGFERQVRSEGDAFARVLLRASEAVAALELSAAALERAGEPAPAGNAITAVEGPRGPLIAERGGWRLAAPGTAEARALAAEKIEGEEWAAALAIAASFDLTPWDVPA